MKQEVLEHFQAGTKYERIQVQFLDTANKSLSEEGWFARIRKKEFSKDFELTYKKISYSKWCNSRCTRSS